MPLKFLGPVCLCKQDHDWVDITTFGTPFRLILCQPCLAYRILERDDRERNPR